VLAWPMFPWMSGEAEPQWKSKRHQEGRPGSRSPGVTQAFDHSEMVATGPLGCWAIDVTHAGTAVPVASGGAGGASGRRAQTGAGSSGARAGPLRVALVGYGAIGTVVARELLAGVAVPGAVLTAVLVRTHRPRPPELPPHVAWYCSEGAGPVAAGAPSGSSGGGGGDGGDGGCAGGGGGAAAFFRSAGWDIAVEVAGQPSVRAHGARCLHGGRDYLVTSIGALTDEALHARLRGAASVGRARLLLAAGAMPACDWMQGASLAPGGATESVMTMTKPPRSWRGTPAEQSHDLAALSRRTVLFEGTAREAASRFPKNSNIAAMLAFATAGLDRTRAVLVADPAAERVVVAVDFHSATAGRIAFEMVGKPSEDNPATGQDVPFSVLRSIRSLCATEVVGA